MKLAQIPAREIFRNLAKMLKILQDNANLLKIIASDVVLVSQRSLLETANLQPITCIAGPRDVRMALFYCRRYTLTAKQLLFR